MIQYIINYYEHAQSAYYKGTCIATLPNDYSMLHELNNLCIILTLINKCYFCKHIPLLYKGPVAHVLHICMTQSMCVTS